MLETVLAVTKFADTITADQRNKLICIKWLLNRNHSIGEGRTTLMALAFLSIAMESDGQWIEVWDHANHFPANYKMMEVIKLILSHADLEKYFEFNRTKNAIRYNA